VQGVRSPAGTVAAADWSGHEDPRLLQEYRLRHALGFAFLLDRRRRHRTRPGAEPHKQGSSNSTTASMASPPQPACWVPQPPISTPARTPYALGGTSSSEAIAWVRVERQPDTGRSSRICAGSPLQASCLLAAPGAWQLDQTYAVTESATLAIARCLPRGNNALDMSSARFLIRECRFRATGLGSRSCWAGTSRPVRYRFSITVLCC